MTELPQLLDRHLAERGMTREEFAERCCERGWFRTTSEVLKEFDSPAFMSIELVPAAEDVLGLSEAEGLALIRAGVSDARRIRKEANRQARSN